MLELVVFAVLLFVIVQAIRQTIRDVRPWPHALWRALHPRHRLDAIKKLHDEGAKDNTNGARYHCLLAEFALTPNWTWITIIPFLWCRWSAESSLRRAEEYVLRDNPHLTQDDLG